MIVIPRHPPHGTAQHGTNDTPPFACFALCVHSFLPPLLVIAILYPLTHFPHLFTLSLSLSLCFSVWVLGIHTTVAHECCIGPLHPFLYVCL